MAAIRTVFERGAEGKVTPLSKAELAAVKEGLNAVPPVNPLCLLRPKGATSSVWTHFRASEKIPGLALCMLCGVLVSMKDSSTTGMSKHIEHHHSDALAERKQMVCLDGAVPTQTKQEKRASAIALVTRWLVGAGRPFALVNDPGFTEFCSHFHIPSVSVHDVRLHIVCTMWHGFLDEVRARLSRMRSRQRACTRADPEGRNDGAGWRGHHDRRLVVPFRCGLPDSLYSLHRRRLRAAVALSWPAKAARCAAAAAGHAPRCTL
jgi:hypothetical protein